LIRLPLLTSHNPFCINWNIAPMHILIALLAHCLQVTRKHRLLLHAAGLMPLAVLDNWAEIKMIDV
jgi:hypothetical protein